MSDRQANARVEKLFVDRWSPRSFDQSAIPDEDLNVIFEAAGLAPSAYNYQPWTFLYSKNGDSNWERFLSHLVPFNQSWAKTASTLVYIVSDTQMRQSDGTANPAYTNSFDAGAAWAQMALQATAMGYHTHGMIGLDIAKATEDLKIPEGYRLEAAIAIGRKAPADLLPEGLREREAPSGRKPVSEIAFAGDFR